MARRQVRSHGVLEWAYSYSVIGTGSSGTPQNDSIDLDLTPDEIAEIWNIETLILPTSQNETDDAIFAGMALSMDPDYADNPLVEDNLADLEVFYSHRIFYQQGITTDGFSIAQLSDMADWQAVDRHPILVGTNVGMSTNYTEVNGITSVTFTARLYFTRRKANARELNQILLKRR